jgi:hypothetical protein
MLSPTKWMMSMYMLIVAKMTNPFIMIANVNFELLCDVNLMISLCCLLPMLETIHVLIKSTQRCFCMRLCYIHQDLPRAITLSLFWSKNKVCVWYFQKVLGFGCLQPQDCTPGMEGNFIRLHHCTFEMEGNFIRGSILVFWTIRLHILGYMFKYQW